MDILFLSKVTFAVINITLIIISMYYILRVRFYTRGFREVWTYMFIALLLSIFALIADFTKIYVDNLILNFTPHALIFLAVIFFLISTHKLHRVFEDITIKKAFS